MLGLKTGSLVMWFNMSNVDPRKGAQDWRTSLAYRLSLGVAAVTILVSLLDLFYAPIFTDMSASLKAQALGQDVVNLVLGVPALLMALNRARRGSLKAKTVLIGVLAYFAYTFLSYGVLFRLNPGFLAYTAAFGLSLYATLLALASVNLDAMELEASPGVRKWTPYALGLILFLIVLLWTPDLAAYYGSGRMPAAITVDGAHTLIIPFQDFSILLPLTLLTIWLIRRDEKLGYILAPVILVKAISIALAVLGMIVVMHVSGTPAVLGQALVFVFAAAILGGYTVRYYRGIEMTLNPSS